MGGEIGAVRHEASPRFAVLATQDPGVPDAPGAPLQRIQIVKGWVDAEGTSHERVFEVAGDPDSAASVDLDTCEPRGEGFASLCAVWEDPEFDRDERAFYYARVLENPTCRWSTRLCNELAVECSEPGSVPPELETCCAPDVERTIQERAWTSPIWYRPEAVSGLSASIHRGQRPGSDRLGLTLRIGRVPPEVDPASQGLSLTLSDDDVIYDVTIPAEAFRTLPGGHWIHQDRVGRGGVVQRVDFHVVPGGRGTLHLRTARTDLSRADPEDHLVDVSLRIGDFTASHTRLWRVQGNGLRVR
jgi:hypothetical protein